MVRIPRQMRPPASAVGPERSLEREDANPADDLAARQADLRYRQSALALLDQARAEDSGPDVWNRARTGLIALRAKAAEALSPGARQRFEQLSQPHHAGFEAELSVRSAATQRRSELDLSWQRQDQALAEFGRLAAIDPDLARLSLAAALTEQRNRNAAVGLAPEAQRREDRALLSRAHRQAVQALTAENPAAAARLLEGSGPVLPASERDGLAQAVKAEQDRREARNAIGDLTRSQPELALSEGGLVEAALATAGEDPARQAAFRAAALGAHRKAAMAREVAEDQAWAAATVHLAGGETWTDLPGPVWSALSPRQRAAIQDLSGPPLAGTDPGASNELAGPAARR